MKYCQKCGEAVKQDLQFCPKCGASLLAVSANQAQVQTQEQVKDASSSSSPAQAQTYKVEATVYQEGQIYPVSDSDKTLRLIAFVFNLITTIAFAILIIPLAWMIPMTVVSWGIYKGRKRNTVAFGVCDLLFINLISGILLLCSHKDD